MNLSESVLGATIIRKLQASSTASILTIGSDTLTRADLAAVGCYNFTAARNLSEILHEHLQVKNLREVYETISPVQLALPRLGSISLAVLGAAFEAKGIGGSTPLVETYVKKHLHGTRRIVTFDRVKRRQQEEAARARRETGARKRARRNTAHAIRVERFETRRA
jgi:hypothetical protein